MKKWKLLLVLTSLLMLTPAAHSFGLIVRDIKLGMGNLTQNVGQVQTNDSGSTNKIEFDPYLSALVDFELTEKLSLIPEINILRPQSGDDDTTSRWNFLFLTHGALHHQALTFRATLGWLFTRISGDGGTQTLNNGNGTDDFIVPDGSTLASNLVAGIGMDFSFLEDWSVGANILVSNTFASEDRAFHYSIQFHYSIEELIYGQK